MQWISLHLWITFPICKGPPPPAKKDIQLLFTHLKAKWHSTSLCLSLLPFAFVIYRFSACLHSHPPPQTHSLYIFTGRSQAEPEEAVKREGRQRRHLCEPHQCLVDSPQTFHLWPFVSGHLSVQCANYSGEFDNTVMQAL